MFGGNKEGQEASAVTRSTAPVPRTSRVGVATGETTTVVRHLRETFRQRLDNVGLAGDLRAVRHDRDDFR